MNSSGESVTACRLCYHYNPEGRRGGICNKLDVPVQPAWESCSLAVHPFHRSWQSNSQDIQQDIQDLNSLFHDSVAEPVMAIANSDITDSNSLSSALNADLQDTAVRSLLFSERSANVSRR